MSDLLVFHDAAQVVCVTRATDRRRRGPSMADLEVIDHGAVIVRSGRIDWVGPSAALPPVADAERIDARGKTLTPGLIDSHTHLIWGGTRVAEFEERLRGASYADITARGGGIQATVDAVRRSSKEELKSLARPRLRRLLAAGVTTAEVKSGYGLSLADEVKCLEAIAELNDAGPLELVPTFLGAHALPREFRSNRDNYVRLLTDDWLPAIAERKLAEFCDVFCEAGAFTPAETDRIFTRAGKLAFKLKLHADELNPLGGAELAVRHCATSADHLLCVSDAGVAALAGSDTVATLLPGTAFFLGLRYAPARRLIDAGATVALASDCNPGTCPTENVTLIGAMACTQMRMLPAETLTALTLNAAAALNRADRLGALRAGAQADLVVWDVSDYRQLFYNFGVPHASRVYKRGRLVFAA